MPALQGARRRRDPPAQRGVLRRVLPAPRARAGQARDRGARHVRAHGQDPGRGLGRQGLARAVGRPARARLPGRRAVPGPRDRRVLGAVARGRPGLRTRTRRAPGRGRPGARLRVRRADRRQEGLAVDLRGLRAVQALRLQPGRARGRVRRDRDRAQPRRRGRHPARQHPAVADRLHRAPVARAARGGGVRAQGQAAVPALGAGDRGVRVPAGDRLRGGGVPARRRQHAAPLQGGDEPARIHVARDQGPVLPRVPRPGGAAVRDAGRGPAGRVRALWSADDGQVLRVLPRAGAGPG